MKGIHDYLFNGCSSAGKTSIARAIQYLSLEKPFLLIGIDKFWDMMPADYVGFGAKADEGIALVQSQDENGSIVQVQTGRFGKKVVVLMRQVIKQMSQDGFDIIVDDVLVHGDDELKEYVQLLKDENVYFVGVYCDLKVMLEREILRGDRAIGLARDQFNKVHGPTREYDLTIDTTSTSPFDNAQKILSFVANNPNPQGFKKLETIFNNKKS